MKTLRLLIIALLVSALNGQEPLTGSQMRDAVSGSLDIISSHLTLLQAQSKYNKMLSNASGTMNIAPVSVLINDGSVVDADLSRLLMNICLGYGKVSSFGLYAGVQWDAAFLGGDYPVLSETGSSQTLAYVGMAVKGFHIDAGIMSLGKEVPLDANGDFASDTNQFPPLDSGASNKVSLYNVYHVSGVYASIATSTVLLDGVSKSTIREFKFNIQPLKRYFPSPAGLPFIDLIGYSPLSAYYNKYKLFYKEQFTDKEEQDNKKWYDLTLGSDDIMKMGFRGFLTMKVTKPFAFRKVEAGYTYATESRAQIVAARTQLFMNNGEPDVSVEAFALTSFFKNRLTFALSYSYNSPDNTTFLPLPDLHVIGLQAILGRRETAKAIIPYAAKFLADVN